MIFDPSYDESIERMSEEDIERECDEVDTFDKLHRWYDRPSIGEDIFES